MATALRLEILLEAVDRLTGPLGRARTAIAGVASAAARVGQGTGATLLARSLGQVASQATAAAGAIADVGLRAGAIGTGAAAAGVVGFNRLFLGVADTFEQLEIRLRTATGSQERAAQAMEWIRDAASRSPASLREVTDAYIRLQSVVDEVPRYYQAVSDAAMANGRSLEQAAEAFNDATRGQFERLKEFGVAVRRENDTLTFNYTRHGQRRVAVIRNANEQMIADTLRSIWSDAHEGATEAAANSWRGLISNLGDQWDAFAKRVMDAGVFDWLKNQVRAILVRIEELNADGTLQRWAESMASGFLRAFEAMREFLLGTDEAPGAIEQARAAFATLRDWVNWLTERFGGANTAIAGLVVVFGGPIIGAIAGLAVSLATLGLVIAATPIGWFVAGMAAIAGVAVVVYRNWGPIADFFERLWDGITDRFEAAWETIKGLAERIGNAISFITGGTPQGQGALTQPDAQAQRRANMRDRGRNLGWTMPPGLEEMERNAANAAALAQRPEMRVDTGGTLRILLEDARAQVRGQSNDPGTRYDVRQGLSMAAQP